MAGAKIQGYTSGNVMEVDSNNNVKVNLPLNEDQAGYSALAGVVSEGITAPVSQPRVVRRIEGSAKFRARAGIDSLEFFDYFGGTASTINTSNWKPTTATMTVTVAEGFMNLNAAGSVTNAQNALVQSYRALPYYADAALRCDIALKVQQVPQNNNTLEWGLGVGSTGTAAPTDGAFWRITNTGSLTCVATNNTVEQTVSLNFQPQVNVRYEYTIIIDMRQAFFYINSQLYAVISAYTTNISGVTASNLQQIFFRCTNTGAVTVAQQLKVASVSATLLDIGAGRTWVESMCGSGQNAQQFASGPNANVGTTSNWANNGAPTSFAANNTTQATTGYVLKLGGQFLCTNTASAASDTDMLVYGFINPASTAANQGRTLYITGVRVDAIHFGATNATAYNTVQWALNVGASALSDAVVADTNAGVKQYRRIPFGNVAVLAAASIGMQYGDLWGEALNIYLLGLPGYPGTPSYIKFQSPLIVYAGEVVAITARFWNTGATASTTIRGICHINGYWE